MLYFNTHVWLTTFIYSLVDAGVSFQHLGWSLGFNTGSQLRLHRVSLDQCHQECLARAQCKSFSYIRQYHECLLKTVDGTTESKVRTPGVITSEKRTWDIQTPSINCQLCGDVCDVNSGLLCITSACGSPTVLDVNSNIQGNRRSVGSKVRYVCSTDTTVSSESECLSTGLWSLGVFQCSTPCSPLPTVQGGSFMTPFGVGEGAIGFVACTNALDYAPITQVTCQASGKWSESFIVCWTPVLSDFNGMTKWFQNPNTSRWWHNDGGNTKRVNVLWQPRDSFVYFDLTYQSDLSYKLYDYGAYVCDGYGSSFSMLHTKTSVCQGEDYTHFYIYKDSVTNTYMLKSKGSGRIVRIDDDQLVTTKENLGDEKAIVQILD